MGTCLVVLGLGLRTSTAGPRVRESHMAWPKRKRKKIKKDQYDLGGHPQVGRRNDM